MHEPSTISPRRAVVVRVFARYLDYGYALTYWEASALCALMQGGGLVLGLSFEPHVRGLHSEGVMRTMTHLEGVCFEGFLAHRPDRPIYVDDFALRQVRMVLDANTQHADFVLKMARLIEGFESPLGVWLLSQCWWLRVQEGLAWSDVLAHMEARQSFDRAQLRAVSHRLKASGWFKTSAVE